jgi:UPF0176 protein
MNVLLFYKFVDIENPTHLVETMKVFCQRHNLKGRVIITKDGINGTVGGDKKDTDSYKEWMQQKPEFKDVWFKEHTVSHNPFPRMQIRERQELVTIRIPLDPKTQQAGKHVDPNDVNELAKDPNTIFFDARNEIESRIGKFKNAICPNMKTFRDLPKAIEAHKEELRGKKIIMYCTGGIRCETGSILMKQLVPDAQVYQINGGIYNYCQNPQNDLWEGTCYVFDDRLQVGWDKDGNRVDATELSEDKIISFCEFCGKKECRVVNDERYLERVERVCCADCDKRLDISRMRTKEERAQMLKQARDTKKSKEDGRDDIN